VLTAYPSHKDYLFQKALAASLPLDSFRFDFRYPSRCVGCCHLFNNAFNCRGSRESGGVSRHGGLANDVEDLRVVVAYLIQEYGYKIDLLVGHSRGSLVAMRWLCTSDEGKNVGGFVNVSARYKMDVRGIPIFV
jgi:pimeloyl-ACP methyl ester carboxylesterase